ncbi:MAG TPA: hypothetical protein VM264_07115, partial [Acidimicrobiales bacterium]|nr:hypothetical protein [Acidimicrobiales bacterium]
MLTIRVALPRNGWRPGRPGGSKEEGDAMWQLGTAANLVVAATYLLITAAIVRPLVREKQLRANPLGTATALIFFTCAVHHGSLGIHMLLPYLGAEDA